MTAWSRLGAWAAQPATLAASFAAMVLFSVLMNAPGLPASGAEFSRLAGGPPFDFRFGGYGVEDFTQAYARAGAEGAAVSRAFMALDVPFPAIYALFWFGLFQRAAGTRQTPLRWLAVVPLVTALVDYAENAFLALAFAALPTPPAWLVRCASLSTQLKGFATSAILLAAVASFVGWWVERRARRG